ncbi:MAG: hypothetical protein HQ513_14365 [Rhodospirillales bacterium]|nr:hypothetical protein [Rhodospirillales bacterium]
MSTRTNIVNIDRRLLPQASTGDAGDNAITAATLIVAKARAECMQLGLTPRQFADLILPEALLAMMVHDMTQEEVEDAFQEFARDEIAAWFFQVKRATGFCDCAREALAEHAHHCDGDQPPLPQEPATGEEKRHFKNFRSGNRTSAVAGPKNVQDQ